MQPGGRRALLDKRLLGAAATKLIAASIGDLAVAMMRSRAFFLSQYPINAMVGVRSLRVRPVMIGFAPAAGKPFMRKTRPMKWTAAAARSTLSGVGP